MRRQDIQVKAYRNVAGLLLRLIAGRCPVLCVVVFCLLFPLTGKCQPGGEIGVMGGMGYYIGDYNPGRHFMMPQRYLGGFYRYNLNDRFAIRLNAGFSDIDIRDVVLPDNAGKVFPTGFKTSVKDFGGMMEFNFRSFMVSRTEKSSWWSPYIFLGVGFLGTGDEGGVSIPFGVGMKFNLYRQLSWGVEWSGRKLFTDRIDGLDDPWGTGETNFLYNKDWFFPVAVTLSYRFPMNRECHF